MVMESYDELAVSSILRLWKHGAEVQGHVELLPSERVLQNARHKF
jgi:hypothetical protein